jgi:uridine kinase
MSNVAARLFDTNVQERHRRELRTLLILLLEATEKRWDVRLSYSVGDGFFIQLLGDKPVLPAEVRRIKDEMAKAIAADKPIRPAKIKRAAAIAEIKKRGHLRAWAWLNDYPGTLPPLVRIGKTLHAFKGMPFDHTGAVGTWDLVHYPPGVLLRMPPNGTKELKPYRERPTLFRTFYVGEQWGRVHGANYVSQVNERIRNGGLEDLIQVSEAQHERSIATIADKIVGTKPRPMVVLISGPSSSGKTSFSMRLATHLRLLGLKPYALGLDNYYLPRKRVPHTEEGGYDYEALEALDIELFNEHVLRLISGETVRLPYLDFKSHKRRPGPPVTFDTQSILIVEGIHGLNPKLTPHVTKAATFKVYVSALTHPNFDYLNRVSTTDLRLLRRTVRDLRARGYSANDTLTRWASVRLGELRNIFPFQEEADEMFNSTQPFELNALKPLAEKALAQANDPEVRSEVTRLQVLLKAVVPIDQELLDRHLPPTSILREFTGGSVLVG